MPPDCDVPQRDKMLEATTEDNPLDMTTNPQSKKSTFANIKETKTPKKREYTLSEVAKHSDAKDAWTVVNGRVYDITKFLT